MSGKCALWWVERRCGAGAPFRQGGLQRFIKSAAEAEGEVLEPTPEHIIMDALWVLVVKCKLRKSLKK